MKAYRPFKPTLAVGATAAVVRWAQVLSVGLVLCGTVAVAESPEPDLPRVLIETELGVIELEIFANRAPLTATNFLRYVDEGRFVDASFYRTVRADNQPNNDVKIDVIQGGLGFDGGPGELPPIAHETTEKTGIRHLDGVISMARNDPGSASSEIFICVGDQPELNFGGRRNPDGQGFAAFGRVVDGLEAVHRIHQSPQDEQMLRPPIRILSVRRMLELPD